jgi:hypothetical protein
MICKLATLFRGRHFTDEIIVLCVRWYLRYSLSYRDLTEIMCERNRRWRVTDPKPLELERMLEAFDDR